MIKTIARSNIRSNTKTGFGFFKMISLARQRRTLAALDDHILSDIGLTRAQAEAEADRPIWDAPSSWKR
jgi:uncharacterized protein YjiS (DUF1127 family)